MWSKNRCCPNKPLTVLMKRHQHEGQKAFEFFLYQRGKKTMSSSLILLFIQQAHWLCVLLGTVISGRTQRWIIKHGTGFYRGNCPMQEESVRIPYLERRDVGHCALTEVPGGLLCTRKGSMSDHWLQSTRERHVSETKRTQLRSE